jgi:putative ABC transport system permease protein
LAVVGIYGVLSYTISQRTHEIGVRMALGARGRDVLRLVLLHGLRLVGAGVAAGVLASWALTRLMRSLLSGVEALDPWTLVAVSFLLIAVTMLAAYLPARRAAHADPLEALRYE